MLIILMLQSALLIMRVSCFYLADSFLLLNVRRLKTLIRFKEKSHTVHVRVCSQYTCHYTKRKKELIPMLISIFL